MAGAVRKGRSEEPGTLMDLWASQAPSAEDQYKIIQEGTVIWGDPLYFQLYHGTLALKHSLDRCSRLPRDVV